jgi:NAD(P)-dependent dehydrogenase (short-subunit alcohol dehydrogenase family)
MSVNQNFIPDRFRGHVALVIGGAQGIGRAIAMRLAREGALVVVGDIDRGMMLKAAREAQAAGCTLNTMFCDVRARRDIERLVAHVIRLHKRIDVLMYIAVSEISPGHVLCSQHKSVSVEEANRE